ncbi:MAG: YncE family protein [Acetobacteraceae bacterium]|nr:YncE family protein [Acetobacteraceae bacterium]
MCFRLGVTVPALVLLTCAAMGFGIPRGLASGVAFIVNSSSASISVIDMTSRREVRRIPALREPHHLVLSPDGKSLLVGDTVGNQIMFLDPATGAVQRRVTVSDPYHLAFSPNGKLLVVNGLARNQVDVYDAAAMTLIKRFAVDSTPSHLDFSPDSRFAFVSLQGSGKLAAFDLKELTLRWTEPVGPAPAGVIWWRDKVMVAIMGADYVVVADPATGKVVHRIVTGKGAHTLFLAPDKKIMWVNNRASGTTVSLDAETLKTIRVYNIPGGPDDIDFAPDGTLWITRRFAEKVAILHPDTGDFETIGVGRSPHGLWLNPAAPRP